MTQTHPEMIECIDGLAARLCRPGIQSRDVEDALAVVARHLDADVWLPCEDVAGIRALTALETCLLAAAGKPGGEIPCTTCVTCGMSHSAEDARTRALAPEHMYRSDPTTISLLSGLCAVVRGPGGYLSEAEVAERVAATRRHLDGRDRAGRRRQTLRFAVN